MNRVFPLIEEAVNTIVASQELTPYRLLRKYNRFPEMDQGGTKVSQLTDLMERKYLATSAGYADRARIQFVNALGSREQAAVRLAIPVDTLKKQTAGMRFSSDNRKLIDKMMREDGRFQLPPQADCDALGKVAAAEVVHVACEHPYQSALDWDRLHQQHRPLHPLNYGRFLVTASCSIDPDWNRLLDPESVQADGSPTFGELAAAFEKFQATPLGKKVRFNNGHDLLSLTLEWRPCVLFVFQNLSGQDYLAPAQKGATK